MQSSEFSLILKPSPLGGIGVFATHDIPTGTVICTRSFTIRKLKAKDIPDAFKGHCAYLNDEEYLCPEQFDRMEIGWYINHSTTPNIAIKNCIKSPQEIDITLQPRPFHAIKDIQAGDEILVDYNYLEEPEHLKEEFYKRSSL